MNDKRPDDLADARTELLHNVLKFGSVMLLAAVTVVVVPLAAVYLLWMIELAPVNAAVKYAESGKVIGQTIGELDVRYQDFQLYAPETVERTYCLGVVDIDSAYYLHVSFDPTTRRATKAILEHSSEHDSWRRDVTTSDG